jgi:phosphoribosylaminoimidazole-succinocarboxamide synthase
LYSGSVKNVKGPVACKIDGKDFDAVSFEYTDAYSVFDWGRMPDDLAGKGRALAVLAGALFEELGNPTLWREFKNSEIALAMAKDYPSKDFERVGKDLEARGVYTHYLGIFSGSSHPEKLTEKNAGSPVQPELAVKRVGIYRPELGSVLGRTFPDYQKTRAAPAPKLIPLEVVFRFSCPPGSSLIDREKSQPGYLASLGFGGRKLEPGARWDFPILELFTKLESSDRPVGLLEALAISGLNHAELESLLFQTAWIAGYLKFRAARAGLELADGKLEWALDESRKIILVDAVGPDELRLLSSGASGVQLSKEFLRDYYRSTAWYGEILEAKEAAKRQGIADWKTLVKKGPEKLPPKVLEVALQLYPTLTNVISGKKWFQNAWDLEKLIEGIRSAGAGS